MSIHYTIGSSLSFMWIMFSTSIFSNFDLNEHEKMVLTYDVMQITLNLFVPLYVYWKNIKQFTTYLLSK